MIDELNIIFPNGVVNYTTEELNSIFSDELVYKEILMKVREHKILFRKVHLELERIQQNNINISDDLLSKLNMMDHFYNNVFTEEDFKEESNSKELSYELVLENLNKRINNMTSKDKLDDNKKRIVNEIDEFKLINNFRKIVEVTGEINSVTIITPSQILSRYNEPSIDGQIGIGAHYENFKELLNSVYDVNFYSMLTDQDLLIRYVSSVYKGTHNVFVTLYIPKIINSTQKIALQKLEEEIKDCISKTGVNVFFSAQVYDSKIPLDKTPVYELNNLTDILKIVYVNDTYNYPYIEKNFIGESNLDFSYLKSIEKIK